MKNIMRVYGREVRVSGYFAFYPFDFYLFDAVCARHVSLAIRDIRLILFFTYIVLLPELECAKWPLITLVLVY